MRNVRTALALFLGLLGTAPVFATGSGSCAGPSDDPGGVCDVTAALLQVTPAGSSVAMSSSTQTNYVKYSVTLKHYTDRREGFSQVRFIADTGATGPSGTGPASIVAATTPAVSNSLGAPTGSACVISGTNATHIECTVDFSPSAPFDYPGSGSWTSLPQPTISFDLTVRAPTGPAGGTIGSVVGSLSLNSETRYNESNGQPEPEYFVQAVNTDLTVPDPAVVETYLPNPGSVTTGTNAGAATCAQPLVTIAKVPQSASVGLAVKDLSGVANQNDPERQACPLCDGFLSKLNIPGSFAATNPLVVTLRRDRCTIEGRGIIGKALQILSEKIFYQKDGGVGYDRVYSCQITGGPFPGQPCIASRKFYTIFNLPNVPNKWEYYGDHEWVIHATENGKYQN